MPSLSSVFGASSSRSASARESKESLNMQDETSSLRESLRAVSMAMNDDVEGAERELAKGDSVYQKVCITLAN